MLIARRGLFLLPYGMNLANTINDLVIPLNATHLYYREKTVA